MNGALMSAILSPAWPAALVGQGFHYAWRRGARSLERDRGRGARYDRRVRFVRRSGLWRIHGAIVRTGCLAAAAFIGFLLFVLVLSEVWPDVERSRAHGWVLYPAIITLFAVEVFCYWRASRLFLLSRFFRANEGVVFVIGTTRKNWYPLFVALGDRLPGNYRFVWWRERYGSPLRALDLARPPSALPCAAIVRQGTVAFRPLGAALRPLQRRPLRAGAAAAVTELVRAVEEERP
ncbi:MAG: hypothetical protein JWO56_1756 [Acidobacteria bacterium]|nr:hypothetical protein [Acidobacteriota bacterium]